MLEDKKLKLKKTLFEQKEQIDKRIMAVQMDIIKNVPVTEQPLLILNEWKNSVQELIDICTERNKF